MTSKTVKSWFRRRDGWLSATSVGICVFALGYSAATIHWQSQYATNQVRMAQTISLLTKAYADASAAKDLTIATLSEHAAAAANSANDAAHTANKAAKAVVDAADAQSGEHPGLKPWTKPKGPHK